MILHNGTSPSTPQAKDTSRERRSGFTLMEMMVVVAILVVLVGVAVPIYLRYLDQAKLQRARADVETLSKMAQMFKSQYGEFPTQITDLLNPPDGRGALI